MKRRVQIILLVVGVLVLVTIKLNSTGVQTQCASMPEGKQHDSCYWALAFSSQNPELCNNISAAPMRDNCYYEMAWRTNNAGVCKAVADTQSGWKDECYRAVAEVTKNPVLCEQVIDEGWKQYCRASAYGDASFCDTIISPRAKSECTRRAFIYKSSPPGR
jgi:hypothetical protein